MDERNVKSVYGATGTHGGKLMRLNFEESIITTIIILINILVFGIPTGNHPIKTIGGFTALWIICYYMICMDWIKDVEPQ